MCLTMDTGTDARASAHIASTSPVEQSSGGTLCGDVSEIFGEKSMPSSIRRCPAITNINSLVDWLVGWCC